MLLLRPERSAALDHLPGMQAAPHERPALQRRSENIYHAGSMEHLHIVPVRLRVTDDDLTTTRLRGIGFRATNNKTWEGPIRKLRQDAVRDLHDRRAGIDTDLNPHE